MKKILLIPCFLLAMYAVSYAKILRVGFTDIPPVGGIDYPSFYLAHQAAVNGDTIYVYPGKSISQNGWPTDFGRAQITKRLVIVGKGNWLDSESVPKGNAGMQASKGSAIFGGQSTFQTRGIYFLAGSDGSTIMGFNGEYQYINIQANNITIKSNYNIGIFLPNLNISGLIVEKNYRVYFNGDDNKNFSYTGFIIRNNFIYQFSIPDHSYTGVISNNTFAFDNAIANNGGDLAMSYYAGTCASCLIEMYIQLRNGSWLFENNLIVMSSNNNVNRYLVVGANNSTLNYNVALESTNFTVWPGSNNTGNVFIPASQVADIFEAFPAIGTSSADGRYRLKANSPAKAGSALRPNATTDAGMYGGNNPYKLSTIPSIPTIYSISSPQGNAPTGNTIQINISTRSNN